MITKDSQSANAFKIIAGLLFLIWSAGAVIAGLYYSGVQKQQCIEREGWLKGIFLCSTETENDNGMHHLLHGLFWPAAVISSLNSLSAEKTVIAPKAIQEEFEKSALGMAYVCRAIAVKNGYDEDVNILTRTLALMNEKDPLVSQIDNAYAALATKEISHLETETSKSLVDFYRAECAVPAKNMRRALK